jgi:anti-anti-sigma factor
VVHVNLHRSLGIPVLTVSGSVTVENRSELISAFETILEGPDRVLGLDLRAVTHISSSGVGSILNMKSELKKRGGDLALIAVSSACQTVLSLLSLSDFFRRFEDEESALKWLGRMKGP